MQLRDVILQLPTSFNMPLAISKLSNSTQYDVLYGVKHTASQTAGLYTTFTQW